jgi:hypothetical protein
LEGRVLPDLPSVKTALRAKVLKFAVQRIPIIEPLLGEVGHLRQHEGRAGQMIRNDASTDEINYPRSEFGIPLSRDEMKSLDVKGLLDKLNGLAEQMAEAQARMMLAKVSESAKEVGNTVSTGGEELTPEHLFEMMATVEWSFDPETEEPTGMSFVMHPDTAAKIIPLVKEWEQQPEFKARHEQLVERKREEWRARENRRKLVD